MKQSLANLSPTRRLTVLYLAALASIAILSIVGQILIQWTIQNQDSDALVINVAGKQRMLSQQISKDALILEFSTDANQRAVQTTELHNAVTVWQQVQEGLQNGDASLGLPGHNSATVQKLFHLIQPDFEVMAQATQSLLAALPSEAIKPGQLAATAPYVRSILAHESKFLNGMNAIVSQYQSEAETRVATLRTTELALLGITLVVLTAEALFVFRPATRQLRQTITEIVALEAAIAQQKRELELGIEQLLDTHVQVANGNFEARAPLSQDHVLWQIAYSLNNLLARFHRLYRLEAEFHQMQAEATRATGSLQKQTAYLKRELESIQADMTYLTDVVREAKAKARPIPAARSRTIVETLWQELNGSYIYPALSPGRSQ